MKRQEKDDGRPCLQTGNNRWKWMAGASAATAAGVTASQAGTITVNLLNNYISATGGNHLNADLTGDGQPDVMITNAAYRVVYRLTSSGVIFTSFNQYFATVDINEIRARAFFSNDYNYGIARLGSRHGTIYHSVGSASLTGSIPISFSDLHINGGALTKGFLEVTVSTPLPNLAKIQLNSFTYNARENVSDQGSSLALLAMGAGGVLALRRRRTAQRRS